jgi:hypothetical protein
MTRVFIGQPKTGFVVITATQPGSRHTGASDKDFGTVAFNILDPVD